MEQHSVTSAALVSRGSPNTVWTPVDKDIIIAAVERKPRRIPSNIATKSGQI
jgi:hypothetical protein